MLDVVVWITMVTMLTSFLAKSPPKRDLDLRLGCPGARESGWRVAEEVVEAEVKVEDGSGLLELLPAGLGSSAMDMGLWKQYGQYGHLSDNLSNPILFAGGADFLDP